MRAGRPPRRGPRPVRGRPSPPPSGSTPGTGHARWSPPTTSRSCVRGTIGGLPFAYARLRPDRQRTCRCRSAFPVLVDRLLTELAGAALPPDATWSSATPSPSSREPAARSPPRAAPTTEVVPGGPAPVADRARLLDRRSAEGRPERVGRGQRRPGRVRASSPPPSLLDAGPPAPAGRRAAAGAGACGLAWSWPARSLCSSPSGWWPGAAAAWAGASGGRPSLVRIVIAALLVAALLDAAVVRPADRVATMFLLDGSASLGAGGRAEAVDWVRSALGDHARRRRGRRRHASAATPGSSSTVQPDADLDQPSAQHRRQPHQPRQPPCASAGAVLPADARRRIVVVSDGRATDGDAAAEADRLREQGIDRRVPCRRPPGRGRPRRGRGRRPGVGSAEGESFDVDRRRSIGRRQPGRSSSPSSDGERRRRARRRPPRRPHRGAGSRRWPGAAVSAATRSRSSGSRRRRRRERRRLRRGAGRRPGVGAARRGHGGQRRRRWPRRCVAGGLVVDVIDVARPCRRSTGIAAYQAVVLVDVRRPPLTADQVATLAASTRDLGHGLVTLGGRPLLRPRRLPRHAARGAAAGHQRDHRPAAAPVAWPRCWPSTRRGRWASATAPSGQGQSSRLPGGVEKTDIARAAAARAIEALSEIDEVGVLAFNTQHEWLVDLQQLPSERGRPRGPRRHPARPAAPTCAAALATAAEQLRESSAPRCKHIILFTDGFTADRRVRRARRRGRGAVRRRGHHGVGDRHRRGRRRPSSRRSPRPAAAASTRAATSRRSRSS